MKSSKTVAKLATRRREQLRRQCDGLVEELKTRIIRLEAAVPPTEEDVDIATAFSEEVGKRLDRLEEAVLECQAFEDDEEDAEDDSFDHVNGLRTETISVTSRLAGLRRRARDAALQNNAPRPQTATPASKAFNFSALSEVDQDISLRGFKEWRKKWESNGKVFNLTSFSRDIQVHSLLTAIGAHAGRIIVTHYAMDLEDEGTTVTLILDNLQAYYRSQRNLTVDRVNFVQRKQGPHETFDQFRFALADMADDAELCQTCCEEQIVTRIIAGTTDEKARIIAESDPFCALKTISLQFQDSTRLEVLPDSGSGANLMSTRDYRRLGYHEGNLVHTGDAIYAANNLGINSLGRHVFKVNLNGISTHALFLITDEYKGTLINRETCQVLRIIPDDFPKQIRREQTVQAVSTPTLEEVKTCSTVWKKGKEHCIPDALSRAPIRDPTPEDLDDEQGICGYCVPCNGPLP
ncbi:Uncharacterized protein FKW44_016765 [Caligus rogercresseyi]|uniref:Uncharacterized protein n=1 Tax=Caligus rogercresseyi TaxID=217165 RepID=A0A7T8H2W5_CALRO|nr:Uncharacterized protein FKW44_016765 [Caligus rogercresseyi]